MISCCVVNIFWDHFNFPVATFFTFVPIKQCLRAIAEYPVQIEAGGKGLASTRQVSSVAGSLNEAISYVLATRLCLATHQ